YLNDYDGSSWNNTDLKISNGPGSSNQLFPSIAVDNDNIYVVWYDDQNGDYDIYFNQYNGTDWGTSDIRICNDDNNYSQIYPSIAAENSNIYVSWKDNRSGKYDVYFNKYDGSSWGNNDTEISNIPNTKCTNNSSPAPIAVENGKLYVAWEDNRSGEWNIHYNSFESVFWGTEDKKLSDMEIFGVPPTDLPSADQVKPAIAVDDGNISVSWQHQLSDGTPPIERGTPPIEIDIYFNDYKPRYISRYPTNLALDAGNDNDIDWNRSGLFDGTETTTNFAAELNSYLVAHESDEQELIAVPLTFHSDTGGYINISNIRIIYDIEPPVMFGNTIENCDYGFFLNGTSPEITNNTIEGNDANAV
ncbi:MAG: hypothetical protein KAJ51_03810, partial [Thermoplasmata archaeon]|nr:hypothetical protein [Thermoplasmata archaeon]